MSEVTRLEFARRLDGMVYTFLFDGVAHDYPSYRRLGTDLWCRRLPDFGWCTCNNAGVVNGRPLAQAGFGSRPPEGMWVSAQGDRSYVYDLVLDSAHPHRADPTT